MHDDGMKKEVAKEIVEIMRKSPQHGNAVMDLLGYKNYCEILRMAMDN